jgi:DNA-binding MarR family transcriptional regulator
MDRLEKIIQLGINDTESRGAILRAVTRHTNVLNMDQFDILLFIHMNVTPTEMAHKLGISHQGVMSRINKLVEIGIVTKEPSGRELALGFTESGASAFGEYSEVLKKEMLKACALLTDEDIDAYLAIQEKVKQMIDVS